MSIQKSCIFTIRNKQRNRTMETFEQTMKRLQKQKETTSQVETSKQIVTNEFMRLQMMNSLTNKERLEMEYLESLLNAPLANDLIRVAEKIKS